MPARCERLFSQAHFGFYQENHSVGLRQSATEAFGLLQVVRQVTDRQETFGLPLGPLELS